MNIAPDKQASAASGFTLIEILVVLSLVALIAAFALPRLVDSDARHSRALQQQLLGKAQTLRADAIRTGEQQVLAVAAVDDRLRFTAQIGNDPSLIFFADGSSNGGVLSLERAALVEIDWMNGTAHAAR